jgi:hypothetical protein
LLVFCLFSFFLVGEGDVWSFALLWGARAGWIGAIGEGMLYRGPGQWEQVQLHFNEKGDGAERRLSEFNPQNVANTAWAFATLIYRAEKLFAALAI